jgi:hypothetical protein
MVATTACVLASMTVRSPEVSFVTYTPTEGGVGAGGCSVEAGSGLDCWLLHATEAIATSRLIP